MTIETANRAFLSMYVPAGHHHLQVIYLPDAFVRGRVISLGTLALIVGALASRRLARWRPRRRVTSESLVSGG